MLDVAWGHIRYRGHDIEPEHFLIEFAGGLQARTSDRAMGKGLRDVSSARKLVRQKGLLPWNAHVRSQTLLYGILIRLDFPPVATGFKEMNRTRQVLVLNRVL